MPIETVQKSLLVGFDREKRAALMGALDSLNQRYGRGTLFPAAAGVKRDWQTKFERKSPRYTTQLRELPTVPCRAPLGFPDRRSMARGKNWRNEPRICPYHV